MINRYLRYLRSGFTGSTPTPCQWVYIIPSLPSSYPSFTTYCSAIGVPCSVAYDARTLKPNMIQFLKYTICGFGVTWRTREMQPHLIGHAVAPTCCQSRTTGRLVYVLPSPPEYTGFGIFCWLQMSTYPLVPSSKASRRWNQVYLLPHVNNVSSCRAQLSLNLQASALIFF